MRNKKTGDGQSNNKKSSNFGPPSSLDVARLANVSRATVSYVLNDVPNSRISEATKARVLKAAADLGYVPNEMASALRTGQSDLVLLPFFDWSYHPNSMAFLQGLSLNLNQLGYTVLLLFVGGGDSHAAVRRMASFHPVGVIVLTEVLTKEDLEILHKNGVQAILGYGNPKHTIPAISIDFTSVGECAAQHLVDRGHHHIASIVPCDPEITGLGEQRLNGLYNIGNQHNLTIDRVDMSFDSQDAAAIVHTWKKGTHPSAVFTYNDEYGLLLMMALQDVGFRIPDDIALVGCDDLPISALLQPPLTSIKIDHEKIIHDVSIFFDRLIRGQGQDDPPFATAKPKLIIRESS